MRVRFYGTRGSIATPGQATVRYGGNTSCVTVRSDGGALVLLDIGTGAAVLGRELMAAGGALRGHILIGHTHWDHIQGLPFFAPLFVPGNEWHIYAPRGLRQTVHDTLAGQMQHAYFPIDLDQLGANIHYHDLVEGTLQIEDIGVTAQYLNHPALTLGYRLEADGASVVYATDHEPHSRPLAENPGPIHGQDRRHADFLAGADLVIHDAQYVASEYASKVGWGHSTIEYAIAVARFAGAKRLALTHHDPQRSDDALDALIAGIRSDDGAGNGAGDGGGGLEIFAAAEGQEIELRGDALQSPVVDFSAETVVNQALVGSTVLVAFGTPDRIQALTKALEDEQVRTIATPVAEAAQAAAAEHPSLLILEDTGGGAAEATARAVRAFDTDISVMLISAGEDRNGEAGHLFDDWLIEPFSSSYARARLRAALMRRACRWRRADLPSNEVPRLAALRGLQILDTPPEERFDRITRLAAAHFDVPFALISLVDENRQWFKSTCGIEASESPRDESFCAHAVLSRQPLIVPDALLDARFAENPIVTDMPRVRFYAGYPLIVADGHCIGTLCILDTRPRDLNEQELARLGDLAELARAELERTALAPPS